MSNRFYRLRSIKSLFQFEELQNQEIYFACPEELNDPMEGFRDIFWQGNEVVWKNLFKHYIFCLQDVYIQSFMCGEECKINENSIPIFARFCDFPSLLYEELFNSIISEFFMEYNSSIKKIASRSTPVKRDELYFYLNTSHSIALNIIRRNFEKHNLLPKRENQNNENRQIALTIADLVDSIEKKLLETNDEIKINMIFNAMKELQNQRNFANKSNNFSDTPNRNFVLFEFSEKYINAMERLIYPNWYTASFMTQEGAYNSSVWGHYGDCHKGVCLIFESNENNSINLYGKNGRGGTNDNLKPSFGWSRHEFREIKYQEGFEKIDFWKSLGHLPIPTLNSTWFFDEQANKSIMSNFMPGSNEDEWRKIYWDNFYRDITIKLKDWVYEREYRLILTTLLDDELEKQYRKLKYDFKSLKGIVFGIKTTEADKAEIIKIIAEKCKENGVSLDEFEFYQAVYSHTEKKIQHSRQWIIYKQYQI